MTWRERRTAALLFIAATVSVVTLGATQRDDSRRDGLPATLDDSGFRAQPSPERTPCQTLRRGELWEVAELFVSPGVVREREVVQAVSGAFERCLPHVSPAGSLSFELEADEHGRITPSSVVPEPAGLAEVAACMERQLALAALRSGASTAARGRLKVDALVRPPKANVGGGGSVVSGRRDRADRVVAIARPRVRACYRDGLEKDRAQEGRVSFSLDVTPQGTVRKVSLEPQGSLSKPVLACVGGVLRSLFFDADEGPAVVGGSFSFTDAAKR